MNAMHVSMIVVGLVTLGVAWSTYKEEKSSVGDVIGASVVTGLVGTVACMLLFGFLSNVSRFWSETTEIANQQSIKSLRTNDRLEGSFWLGSGTIQEVEYYFCYVQVSQGTYEKRKYPIDSTLIVESSASPHVEVEWTVWKNWLSKFTQIEPKQEYQYQFKSYRLIVPPGTVIGGYEAH